MKVSSNPYGKRGGLLAHVKRDLKHFGADNLSEITDRKRKEGTIKYHIGYL